MGDKFSLSSEKDIIAQLSSKLSTSIFLEIAMAEEVLGEVVPMAEVLEACFEAMETKGRSLAAASALATAAATEVEWTCFVLLRLRLPETGLSC